MVPVCPKYSTPRGAERLGCMVIPMSGGPTQRQVQLIQGLKPTIIMVKPFYLLALGDEFERQGLDPRQSSLCIGMHGAAPWTEAMRREIESRFDMLIIRRVNVFPSQIEEQVLKVECLSPRYVLEVRRVGRLDTLDGMVEVKPVHENNLDHIAISCAADLTRHIRTVTGVTAGVRIVPVGQVDRSMGQAKRVIDLRDMGAS